MEDLSPSNIKFLSKPYFDPKKMNYLIEKKELYVNLFEFRTTKELKLYKYPIIIRPEIDVNANKLMQTVLKVISKDVYSKYGVFTISGDTLYSMKKIENKNTFIAKIYMKGKFTYTVEIQNYSKVRTIKDEDIKKDSLTKQLIEILIKDILKSNPNLDFEKGLFVLKGNKTKIESEKVSINYYPGFITKFIETEKGDFINVSLKNKIESTENILDYLNKRKYWEKYNQYKINKDLIGRLFYFGKGKKRIDEILFDRNPTNQTTNIDGKNISIKDYYLQKFQIEIKNLEQPLILTKKKGPQEKIFNVYYIPELCNFSGLDEFQQKDNFFMKELSSITKLTPETRIKQTDRFLDLLIDDTKKDEALLSSKEKSELYGIEVRRPKESFYGYLMEEPKIIAGKKKIIDLKKGNRFPLLKKEQMTNWLCLYEKENYNDADNLYKCLTKSSKGYEIYINEPVWVEMKNNSKPIDWIKSAECYMNEGDEYNFVIFLLGKNYNKLYAELKKHSLCKNGYVSQIIKAQSLKNNRILSICSKILLQINAKLGGVSYKTIIDKNIKDMDIMVIGADSSHFSKRTAIALISTIDESFADFYNKGEILKDNDVQYRFCVSSFIEEAIPVYEKKNNKLPKNIIIYRQGISDNIIDILKEEIFQIEQLCNKKGILFYYILVNTRTTFKFFEKCGNKYFNPGAGLLVIDGVTHQDKFDFFIQPQQVTGGSATPTRFYVAYGNMNCPEIIPKFTFDLCHIYSNWQGTIRIPNVIKAAEKLSKMIVKTTQEELNERLNEGQSYL